MDPREYQIAVRGGRQREMTLGDMVFECPACGWRADRDYNASLNVLRRAGWEPPAAPAELRPLPMAEGRGQGGAVKREAPPFRAGQLTNEEGQLSL